MAILMIARSTLYKSPGGDTTQIEMTAKYLRLLGVEVAIALADETIDYTKYRLIHFFNLIRPDDILPHLSSGLPFVISTIFVDYSEFDKQARKGLSGLLFRLLSKGQIEYLKAVARYFVKGDKIKSLYFLLHGQNKSIEYILRRSELLLPNSHSEYRRLSNCTTLRPPYLKVVNAIDHQVFSASVKRNLAYDNHVLCVGRIEGLKNQLNLIKALLDTAIPLVIIGKPALNQQAYYNECRRLGATASNIQFIEHIDHTKLASIYKAAKVHALPSWFETTGLSSLEAAAMGCNVVITEKGDTKEYFGNMAFYCEPDDVGSIKRAVIRALEAPRNSQLQAHVLQHYTWEKTARQTLRAYEHVLNSANIRTGQEITVTY
ncbi:glycosyltransferase family 4 protein [Pontibacter kalidii]|uniref:glycosyltransferase family 4 protein n=1 Tax=Pontibacter kalidii TaxID=2592049 RepID=UPI00225C1348|nr:glycosyltransferase family 4 protein [Pontibacter kalidii]